MTKLLKIFTYAWGNTPEAWVFLYNYKNCEQVMDRRLYERCVLGTTLESLVFSTFCR